MNKFNTFSLFSLITIYIILAKWKKTRIKKKEVALAELKKELKGWQDKEITLDGETMKVKEAVAKYKKISRRYRTRSWQLRRFKVKFAQQQNIVPIILVERRVID